LVTGGIKPRIVGNRKIVRHVASGHFRNKKEEYVKAKIDEHETNSKIKSNSKLYWAISDFKKARIELV
jgi:hypothetical protein